MFSLLSEPWVLAEVYPYPEANVSSNLTERASPNLRCLVFVTSEEQTDSCGSSVDVRQLLCGPGLCDGLWSARRGSSHEEAPAAHGKAGRERPRTTGELDKVLRDMVQG